MGCFWATEQKQLQIHVKNRNWGEKNPKHNPPKGGFTPTAMASGQTYHWGTRPKGYDNYSMAIKPDIKCCELLGIDKLRKEEGIKQKTSLCQCITPVCTCILNITSTPWVSWYKDIWEATRVASLQPWTNLWSKFYSRRIIQTKTFSLEKRSWMDVE